MVVDIYLDGKGPSAKIQLLHIIEDHHIVPQLSPVPVGYDEWLLSNALWMKFYNSHGKYRPEVYRCQLNFVLFCATSALGTSWQHLNQPNFLLRSVYRFHVYFHVRIIVHHLDISLPHKDGSRKLKHSYIKSAYYSIGDAYGSTADETWMYGDYFHTANFVIFGNGGYST